MNDISSKDIRFYAMNLLARREHSRRELREKLNKKFSNSVLISSVIEQLEKDNLISDQRYAEMIIHSKANKLYGPERIKYELRQAGISDDLIDTQLEASDINWLDSLTHLKQKKFGATSATTPQERAKQYRYFQYRGFDSQTIKRLEKQEK